MAVEPPSVENRPPGSVSGRSAAAAAKPPASLPEAPTAEPGGPAPALGAVRCAQCEADVVPTTPNHCPKCGGWVFDNTEAVVHGLRSKKFAKQVDQYRVGLKEQLFAERGGRDALDVVSRIAIENFALVCAQHKTIEARLDQDGLFTQTGRRRSAFDMLKSISETIERLRSELPPAVASARPATVDYSGLSDDELIDRLEAALAHARGSRQTSAQCPQRGITPREPSQTFLAPTKMRVPAETLCAYGCGTTGRCAELKISRPDTWEALHYTDPDEVARRDKEATEIMVQQVGKTSPW